MSLRKFNLNRESTDIFEVPEVEVEPQDVIDQIQAEEDEVELTEAVAEVEEDMENADEAEEVIEELEEVIEEAKEVIAKADEVAAEVTEGEAPAEGEAEVKEPEVEVADVVAVQESLKYLYKQAGFEPEREGVLSRESALQSPYTAMKMNLEEAEGFLAKTKETLKKIWEKILAGMKWIGEQLKKLWPSREKKIAAIRAALSKVDYTATPEDLKKLGEMYKGKNAVITDMTKVTDILKAAINAQDVFAAQIATIASDIDKGNVDGYEVATMKDKLEASLAALKSFPSVAKLYYDAWQLSKELTVPAEFVNVSTKTLNNGLNGYTSIVKLADAKYNKAITQVNAIKDKIAKLDKATDKLANYKAAEKQAREFAKAIQVGHRTVLDGAFKVLVGISGFMLKQAKAAKSVEETPAEK